MLLVNTYISQSMIHGLGVFSDQNIEEGERIWTRIEGFDVTINEEFFNNLPQVAKKYLSMYSYCEEGKRILPGDNDRYTNHSECPNTIVVAGGDVVALRSIFKSEEITIDYRTFDEKWSEKLLVPVGEIGETKLVCMPEIAVTGQIESR